ncbi:OmpA family protein [Gynurincola endophyticus]|uniref:OmpA family protein n=1 Tax=Gynurincola endophyticus TaxID=2479004 RepID=UPI00131573DD|nr:OmpA family protein [Gynurincola endophyticus]
MKYLLLLLCLCSSTITKAQLKVGFIGGPQFSQVSESNTGTYFHPDYKSRTGAQLGFLIDIPFSQQSLWSLQPALLYSSKGRIINKNYDSNISGADTAFFEQRFKTNYIEFPLHITRHIKLGAESSFFIGAGAYFGAYISGENQNETQIINNSLTTWSTNNIPHEVGNAPNKIKTIDYGLSGRAGFSLKKIILSAFYTHGLQNFYTYHFDNKSYHRSAGASVGFWLNKPEQKPKDTDGDGIPDAADACPFVKGEIAFNGCPDLDGDGIPDKDDACPGVPGLAKYQGCPVPDTDGDGVNDEEDACPTQPGLAKYKGCPVPDTDGDGVNDEEDACPSIPGPIANKGCPWPDTDGDGIPDKDDACPLTPGIDSLKGCAPIEQKVIEKVKLTASNIYFETGSEELKKTSYKSLDELAQILKDDNRLIITIEGHTDNVGLPENNLALSERRALRVKQYIESKGIDSKRIKAIGFGDTKPIADNTTAAGKSKNRRVEIQITQH